MGWVQIGLSAATRAPVLNQRPASSVQCMMVWGYPSAFPFDCPLFILPYSLPFCFNSPYQLPLLIFPLCKLPSLPFRLISPHQLFFIDLPHWLIPTLRQALPLDHTPPAFLFDLCPWVIYGERTPILCQIAHVNCVG